MATRLPTGTRNAIVNAITTKVDAGSGSGYIEVRTGSQPATGNDAASGTLIDTITLAKPSFGTASTGVITLASTPLSAAATAGGTAGWFRVYDSAGNPVFDGSCSGTGGGGDMVIDNPALVSGQAFQITSLTITSPS